ncbi:MAG: hypothetical protein NVSMB12_17580 [Acidimicrobiales bacterium]
MSSLDRATIARGALVDLAVLVPLVVLYAGARAVDAGGMGTVLIVVATVAAPLAGGFTAGRCQLQAPLTHGAAAAGLAVIAYIAFRLADAAVRGTGLHLASIVVFVMLSVTLGLIGGFAGFRTAQR